MQPTNQRERDYVAHVRRLHGSRLRRVLAERQMLAARVIVLGNVSPKQPSEVRVVEYDDVIEQLSPESADQAFDTMDFAKASVGR